MAGPTPAQLVERHRRAQLAVRASFLTEFLAAWGLLRTDDLDRSYPAWIRIVMRLIRAFRQESARLAVDHYRELRRIGVPDAEVDMPEVDFDLGNQVEHLAKVRRTHPEASVPARIIREERELRVPGRRARFTIKWDRADRAAQRGLLGAGPLNIKHRIGRGESPEQAARNAFVDASGAASRHVLNGGRSTNLALVQNDQRAIGYVRVTDGNPCYFCAMLASRGIVRYGRGAKAFDESDARFIGQGQVKVHDHCVVPGTLVTGPSVEVAYRRPYEGELIIVGLADGGELSITPNHPVLTDRGWIEAGLLREGDDVLGRAGADLATLNVPHEDDVPTPIEDVWGSRRMDSVALMPVAAEDFHGDRGDTQGYVDVVAPHREFAGELDLKTVEHRAQQFVTSSRLPTVVGALTSLGDPFADFLTLGGSAECGMGSGGIRRSLLGTESGLVQVARLGLGSTLSTGLLEPARDHAAGHLVAFSQLLLGGSEQVLGHGVTTQRRFDPASATPWAGFDESTAEQTLTERLRVHADIGRTLAERLAGGVQLRRVRELRRVHYSGHVLNLQTAEGWYDADGVIVSNCACSMVPVFAENASYLAQAKKFQDLWNEHIQNRYSGRDAINAWRRLIERPDLFKEKNQPTRRRRAA